MKMIQPNKRVVSYLKIQHYKGCTGPAATKHKNMRYECNSICTFSGQICNYMYM